MQSRHLSLRVEPDLIDRLDAEGRRMRLSRSELAKALLEEGLRMEAHPGIVFRSGPAGRRAAIAGGPDVWEIVRAYLSVKGKGEEAVRQAASLSALEPGQIKAAIRYYAEHQQEIDAWVRRVDEEAEKAEATWRRQQQLLGQ